MRKDGFLCHGTNLTCPSKMTTLLSRLSLAPLLPPQDRAEYPYQTVGLLLQGESPPTSTAFLGHRSPNPSLGSASQHCLAWSVGRKGGWREWASMGLPDQEDFFRGCRDSRWRRPQFNQGFTVSLQGSKLGQTWTRSGPIPEA